MSQARTSLRCPIASARGAVGPGRRPNVNIDLPGRSQKYFPPILARHINSILQN
jgi:hypothetical protein